MHLLTLLSLIILSAAGETDAAAAAAVECPSGFEPAGAHETSCIDIDECQRLIASNVPDEDRRDVCGNYVHGHRPGYRCINTPGSYRCVRIVDCGFGYKLDRTLGVCVDIDECAILGYEAACGLKLPIKVCINLEGSFRCDYRTCPSGRHLDRTTGLCNPCRRGYAKNQQGVCVDVDECELTNSSAPKNSCPPHMRCVNYVGGYECKHKILCPMGWRANYNGTRCEDIDECAEHSRICGVGRNCINLDGSYRCESKQCGKLQELNSYTGECVCLEGFRMNATTKLCEDINECTEGRHNCGMDDVCRNTRGHYDCLSRDKVCEPGFGLSFDHSSCVDIDECRLGQHKCKHLEVCNNTYGSYVCLCAQGYDRVDGSRDCTDIDECAINGTKLCPSLLLCRNRPGSYICNCPDGFQFNNQSGSCDDINECSLQPDICGSVGTCTNSPAGAYTCTCPAGYMATDLIGGTCADIDECRLSACPTGATCHNKPGSYDCQCRSGFLFVRQSNLCEDINECNQTDNECSTNGSSCFNYRGGFACYQNACPEGFRRLKSIGIQLADSLSFSCKTIDGTCRPMPSFHDNLANNESGADSQAVCIRRHRIAHKAQEISPTMRGRYVTIQTDMRLGQRDCQFRAALYRASGLEYQVSSSSQTNYSTPIELATDKEVAPIVRFNRKKFKSYTLCSTEMRIEEASESFNSTDPVTLVQIEVALIKGDKAEISNNTVHLIYL